MLQFAPLAGTVTVEAISFVSSMSATIHAPCGDCNISGLAYIDTSIPAAIRTPYGDYDESASVSNEACDMYPLRWAAFS